MRNTTRPQLQYAESHNDDITEVCPVSKLFRYHR